MAMARDIARAQRQADAARWKTFHDQERQVREAERQYRANQREAAREHRETLRSQREAAKEERQLYLEERQEEAEALAEDAAAREQELVQILEHTLRVDDKIDLDTLRVTETFPAFNLDRSLANAESAPVKAEYTAKAIVPSGWRKMLPGATKRKLVGLQAAQSLYELDTEEWTKRDQVRQRLLEEARTAYNLAAQDFAAKKAARNADVDTFQAQYLAGDADAIVAYCTMVLERSRYPEGLPQKFSVAFTKDSKQLVVEYQLPLIDIVPEALEHRYVRAHDRIVAKPRKSSEIKATYQDVIAAVTLRTIHELFEADHHGHVAVVCFNGYIHTVDPATGRDIQPHLVSVRATREKFLEVDLARADKRACLKNLGALVSRSPEEAQPVNPIVEFKMADARFVDQTDLISGLADAPNLMDLSPFEFETLVANLFGQMGLESKLTRSSKDGGVDCVAFDKRPVLGGKVVIQAKRYRHTVGVSAVRDLYGTMMNEGANKGILVTTSGYGPDAFNFAKDKPIELIEGGGLLYLLQEIGMQVRIVFPEME